ncbi:MAG: aldehyde dehydrogenase family protein [Neisseria sp.]|nr:aldehyde dehydrogenase family protein [Neisseria sp.]
MFSSRDVYRDQALWSRPADSAAAFQAALQDLRRRQQAFACLAVTERTRLLLELAERLAVRREALSAMICEEVGRCLPECRAELDKSIDLIRYYARLAPELLARKTIATQASLSAVAFEPLGVVFSVMPWNYPVWQILRFAVPALCAGNACMVKPAPTVGRVTAALFEVIGEDLPLQAAWLAHEDVEGAIAACDALAFTGSARTGRHLAALAGKYLKKCVLELGGSNAFIVLADADIDAAARDACHSRFRDAGQSCNAAKRLIVVPEIAEAFVEKLLQCCRDLQAGDPMLPETTLACLHLPDAAQQLQSVVDDALAHGAKCLSGGCIPSDGAYYPATVLDHVATAARAAQEEVFGPVAAVLRAHDAEHAVALANDSPFGLGASIYSADVEGAWALARWLQVGSVFINRHTSSDLRLPFGGVKASGFGRELSEFGLYEFVNVKSYWQK